MSQDHTESDFIPPSIEEISHLLPSYEILSFIAKGGMGAVYLASQKSLDRPVAIKILPRHFGEDAEFRTAFETEAKCMAKFNHPNLISIYDFGQVDGLLYIIMEMVEGQSLFHYAYGKTLAPSEVARIVSEVCLGLSNAHKQGILHRDIKPANILLDSSIQPKIGDFGLARPVGEHENGEIFGTPGYTAPEVLHNPSAVDESTDIYSVGAMLYELITGELPSTPYSPAAIKTQCNPKFDQIIRKAMHPSPAMRFRSASAMAEALAPLTDESNASGNPLMAPNSGIRSVIPNTQATPTNATPTVQAHHIKVHSHPTFIRNILIILALLAAIIFAWQKQEESKEQRKAEAAQQAEIAKQAAKKSKKPPVKKRTPTPTSRTQHSVTPPAQPESVTKETPLQPKEEAPKNTLLLEKQQICIQLIQEVQTKYKNQPNQSSSRLRAINNIREKYRKSLRSLGRDLKDNDLTEQFKSVETEYTNTTPKGDAFMKYILSLPNQ